MPVELPPTATRAALRINTATRLLWRSPGVLQLELGDRRIVVEQVEPDDVSHLLTRSTARGASPDDRITELTRVLLDAGFLGPPPPVSAPLGDGPPARLSGDLGALAGRHPHPAAVLARRRASTVAVHGTSRLTTPIASTLAAAGVGRIQLTHGGEVSAGDACPGGLTAADEGRRFGAAAVDAIHRAAPEVNTGFGPPGTQPDLVILTDPVGADPAVRGSLHLDELVHLQSYVDGSQSVIGPLVLPGRTSCLRCADLHRTDRDPLWPALAVQLSARPRHRIPSDAALCVAAAGLAAGQALAYLDAHLPDELPETVDGTLEWQLPDWRLRRRTWLPHHSCECGAATHSQKHGRMRS